MGSCKDVEGKILFGLEACGLGKGCLIEKTPKNWFGGGCRLMLDEILEICENGIE